MEKKSIFSQILIPILSLILLCTITVSGVIYTFAQKLLYNNITESNEALLIQIDGNFTNLIQQLNAIVNVSDSSVYFRQLLIDPYEGQIEKFEKQMALHRFLYNYYQIFTQFKACVTVIGDNGVSYTCYGEKEMLLPLEELLEEDWAAPLMQDLKYDQVVHTLSHPGITTRTKDRNVLLFVRSLVDGNTMQWCGWMFLEIEHTGFEQLYANSYNQGEYIFVVDPEQKVLSSNLQHTIGKKLNGADKIPICNATQTQGGSYIQNFEGHRFLAVRAPLSAVDGYLVKYIDVNIVQEKLQGLLLWIIFLAAIFCIAACLAAFLLFRHITKPIVSLSDQMSCTRYGHLDGGQEGSHKNEIQVLEKTFANLLSAVDSYTENIKQESSARREAELNALRMQINPHFLYNTLSSIRWLAENQCEHHRISTALDQFIRLLQRTISDKMEQITLDTELENLQSYVALMNLRYDGRIQLEILMPDSQAANCCFPKLILQPIVENAIFHGYDADSGIMRIIVFVSVLNDVLRIEISDMGHGIDEETLKQIRQGGYGRGMTGVGFDNVDQRLKLMYGACYGAQIESTLEMGTIVTLELPAIPKEEAHLR